MSLFALYCCIEGGLLHGILSLCENWWSWFPFWCCSKYQQHFSKMATPSSKIFWGLLPFPSFFHEIFLWISQQWLWMRQDAISKRLIQTAHIDSDNETVASEQLICFSWKVANTKQYSYVPTITRSQALKTALKKIDYKAKCAYDIQSFKCEGPFLKWFPLAVSWVSNSSPWTLFGRMPACGGIVTVWTITTNHCLVSLKKILYSPYNTLTQMWMSIISILSACHPVKI